MSLKLFKAYYRNRLALIVWYTHVWLDEERNLSRKFGTVRYSGIGIYEVGRLDNIGGAWMKLN